MKKVTALIGCATRKNTYNAAVQLLNYLQTMGDVETEILRLSEYHIETCKGCKVCFEKGEEHCPLKDDRDLLIAKMAASDGVIFATPNYSFQVSGLLKVFLDRLGFAFHRPRYFGKTFTSIVAQGFYGGDKIVEYLDFVATYLGFNTLKGTCIITVEPIPEKQRLKNDRILARQARQFHAKLERADDPTPSWIKLFVFRNSRTKIMVELNDSCRDFTYYKDKGWFESDYFYPTHLGLLKKTAGKLFNSLSAKMSQIQ